MTLQPLPPGGLPRLTFEARQQPGPAPLRTDIAMFIGQTVRGPVGTPVRLDGMPAVEEVFGGLDTDSNLGHALLGYFENGGRLAWVIRLAPGAIAASETWALAGGFTPDAFSADSYAITAASPGDWGDALSVAPNYRRNAGGRGVLDLDIRVDDRPVERLSGLTPGNLATEVNERSTLVRFAPAPAALPPAPNASEGPRRITWPAIRLTGGQDGANPTSAHYEAALEDAMDVVEPALLVFPDLHRHLGPDSAAGVVLAAARRSDRALDRMVIADAPENITTARDAEDWLTRLGNDPVVHRAVATYHPWIDMRDPVGTVNAPFRRMPPSGHVAGAISRLDRAVGAYVTPANTSLTEAVDLGQRPESGDVDALSTLGFNALRCQSARGIVVWGGRMLRSDDAPPRFVAHRRMLHRLVRAMRQVWAPHVFDPNDVQLRLAIARSATTLLTEAFQTGVLKGTRPDEAFRVTVDDSVNPPEVIEAGRLVCEIAVAPATPMEFIHFRIGLNPDGSVEMIEP